MLDYLERFLIFLSKKLRKRDKKELINEIKRLKRLLKTKDRVIEHQQNILNKLRKD